MRDLRGCCQLHIVLAPAPKHLPGRADEEWIILALQPDPTRSLNQQNFPVWGHAPQDVRDPDFAANREAHSMVEQRLPRLQRARSSQLAPFDVERTRKAFHVANDDPQLGRPFRIGVTKPCRHAKRRGERDVCLLLEIALAGRDTFVDPHLAVKHSIFELQALRCRQRILGCHLVETCSRLRIRTPRRLRWIIAHTKSPRSRAGWI